MNKSFANMDLCEKIKYLRKEKDLSQGALSRISGVSVAEICRIESGERKNPSINLLNKLLESLDVSNEVYLSVTGFNNTKNK
jgi:transcriptional regulator with XRE-family HTH domain